MNRHEAIEGQGEGRGPTASPSLAMKGRAARFALLATPAALLAVLGWMRRWTSDDAFIDYRVVANLLDGFGPVFNLSERVEAYSNPLWVAMLAAWGALGLPLETGGAVLGVVCAAVGVAAAVAAAAEIQGEAGGQGRPAVLVPVGALAFVALRATWDFASSGLETGLAFGWLGVAYLCVTRASRASRRGRGADLATLATAAVAGLGPLVRPDLGLFAAAFLVALAAARADLCRPRALAALAAAAGLLPVGYQIFRMGYFAAMVPNTALAKEAGLAYWGQGVLYAQNFVGTYALFVPAALLLEPFVTRVREAARARDRRALALLVAPAATALAHSAWVVRVGGDFMHARFLLPSLLGALLPVAALPWPGAAPAGRAWWARRAAMAAVAVWAAAVAVLAEARAEWGGIADERLYYTARAAVANPVGLAAYAALPGDRSLAWDGLTLAADAAAAPAPGAVVRIDRGDARDGGDDPARQRVLAARPGLHPRVRLVVARRNVGVTGFAAGPYVHVVDRYGLADPIAGRLELGPRTRIGHDKMLDMAWVEARFADPAAKGLPGPVPADDVAAARQALACRPLAELLAAIERPLTLGRFLANVGAAHRFSRLRVPGVAYAAAIELCGDGQGRDAP